jgi:hypothetical protein
VGSKDGRHAGHIRHDVDDGAGDALSSERGELRKRGRGGVRGAIQDTDRREIGVAFSFQLRLVTNEHFNQAAPEKPRASNYCYDSV